MKIIITEEQYKLLKENDQLNQIEHIKNIINSGEIELGFMLIPSIEPEISEEEFLNIAYKDLFNLFFQITKKENFLKILNSRSLTIHEYIKKIPDSVSLLKNLGVLKAEYNGMNEFPKSILNLPNLWNLNLSQNNISYIPEDIDLLQNLEVFNLSDNKLETLPESVKNLKQLNKFYLGGNKFSDDEIIRIKNLLPKTCNVYF